MQSLIHYGIKLLVRLQPFRNNKTRLKLIIILWCPSNLKPWTHHSSTLYSFLHTYVIGHCNRSIMIIYFVSHITYVECVNFVHEWRDQQFKVGTKRTTVFFEKLFMGIFLLLLFLPQICSKGSCRRNIFFHIFVLIFGPGLEPWLYS